MSIVYSSSGFDQFDYKTKNKKFYTNGSISSGRYTICLFRILKKSLRQYRYLKRYHVRII